MAGNSWSQVFERIQKREITNIEQIVDILNTKRRATNSSQILVIKKDERIHGCPGIVAPRSIEPIFFGIDTDMELGFSEGDFTFDKQRGDLIIPTPQYAQKLHHDAWRLVNGNITVSCFYLSGLGNEIEYRQSSTPTENLSFQQALMIHMGSEVPAYFRGVFRGANRLDVSYVDVLKLLGQEAPEDFKKQYQKETYEKKRELVNRLEILTAEEAKLTERIKFIYDSIKSGGYMEGGALSIVETEDDAKVASIGPRRKLKEIQGTIECCLKETIALEMHTTPLIIPGSKPGITINVPVYIAQLAGKYEIALPK
ncbi:hypothetical protein HYS50_04025 [Candidatus Woesearchaeota archaeon]|nr:hypothetical protein [Candidatus Woesearchaeota archaeon]